MVLAFIDPIFLILRHFIISIKKHGFYNISFSVILKQLILLATIGTFLKLIWSFPKKEQLLFNLKIYYKNILKYRIFFSYFE